MSIPLAHETWFDHGAYPTDRGFAAETPTLALHGAAVLVTLLAMGHLPIHGAILAVLVYGSDPRLRPAVSALLPPRRRRLPTAPVASAA